MTEYLKKLEEKKWGTIGNDSKKSLFCFTNDSFQVWLLKWSLNAYLQIEQMMWNKTFVSSSLLRALFCLRVKQGWGATTWRAAAILFADFKFLRVAGTSQISSWLLGKTLVIRVENQSKLCLRNSTGREMHFKNWSRIVIFTKKKSWLCASHA